MTSATSTVCPHLKQMTEILLNGRNVAVMYFGAAFLQEDKTQEGRAMHMGRALSFIAFVNRVFEHPHRDVSTHMPVRVRLGICLSTFTGTATERSPRGFFDASTCLCFMSMKE